mgnify:CR=1 FL=1
MNTQKIIPQRHLWGIFFAKDIKFEYNPFMGMLFFPGDSRSPRGNVDWITACRILVTSSDELGVQIFYKKYKREFYWTEKEL